MQIKFEKEFKKQRDDLCCVVTVSDRTLEGMSNLVEVLVGNTEAPNAIKPLGEFLVRFSSEDWKGWNYKCNYQLFYVHM